MMEKTNKRTIIDAIVTGAIILVMVQTFAEDLAVLAGTPWSLRSILVYSGFAFDLFFTVEFLIRLFNSVIQRKAMTYLLRERGWIDFAASLPLLIFNSGPALYALMSGMVFGGGVGLLNILKIVKAVRIARILRLLRLLKIFKQIKFADSKMAQHHTTRIITTVVTTFITAISLGTLLFSLVTIKDTEASFDKSASEIEQFIVSEPDYFKDRTVLEEYCEGQTHLLILKKSDKVLFSRNDESFYKSHYGPSDYTVSERGDYQFFFDGKPQMRRQSRDNMIYFITILSIIIVIMVLYSPHFALTVSDPVNVMIKGLKDKNYNLEVAIPEKFKDDDIFVLGEKYNEIYLPMKARDNDENEEGSSLDISLDDIEDLLL